MAETGRIRVGFIGLGVMARVHLADVLRGLDTEVIAVCEPSAAAYAAAALALRRPELAEEGA